MEITILPGQSIYIDDCLEALMNSELARLYLPDGNVARAHLVEAFEKKEMYLALNNEGECVGFIRFVLSGTFYNFPYICNISVKESYRKLYKSIGYEKVGTIDGLYKDGISEYIMMKVKTF